jgi:hypothetical protein
MKFLQINSNTYMKIADETLFKVRNIVQDLEKILIESRRTNSPLKNSPYTSQIIEELLRRLKYKKEEYVNIVITGVKNLQENIAEDIELYTAIRNYLDNPPNPEN